jgi:hypothetical protein
MAPVLDPDSLTPAYSGKQHGTLGEHATIRMTRLLEMDDNEVDKYNMNIAPHTVQNHTRCKHITAGVVEEPFLGCTFPPWPVTSFGLAYHF